MYVPIGAYGKSLINAIVSENTTNDVKKSKLRAIGEVLQGLIRKIQVAWRKHTGTYKMGEAASYVSNLVEVHKELLRAYNGLSVDNAGVDGIMESRNAGDDLGKLTKEEWGEFYSSLGALKRGMWFPQTPDGDYIFETDNKLIFTDGDYENPSISSVIIFSGLDAQEIEIGKDVVYREAQRGKSSEECCETARLLLGKGHVASTDPYNNRAYRVGKDYTGKRSESAGDIGKTDAGRSGSEVRYSVGSEGPEGENDIMISSDEGNKKTADEAVEEGKQKNTANELLDKLIQSIPTLQSHDSVYKAEGTEFSRGEKQLSEQVGEYFSSIGGKVYREGFGDVILNDKGIADSIAHGIGRAKAITFSSVPDVIKHGQQIDYQQNWKGRGYDTYVFAAPVEISGMRTYVAVIVRKTLKDNKYYLHEVVDLNGNIIKKDDIDSFKSRSHQKESPGESMPSSTDTVSQEDVIVKRDDLSSEMRMSVSSTDIEERSSMENRAYEIENAVSDRLSEMLEVKLTDATRDAVKVYALSSAMGDEARINASLNNLTDSIIRNEAPVTEVQAEDDGFLETLRGVKKVYVSDYARQGMSVSDVNRTFGIGKWSGKEGLPVDVLYNNMVSDGITLPEADTIQDKLIAIRDRKAELTEVRREKLPRDEVRSIIDYAVDLGDYKTSGISEDVAIPEAGSESRIVQKSAV